MKTYKIYILFFVFFSSLLLKAQTSNYGDFVVVEGTQFATNQAFVNASNASFINDGETFFYNDLTNNGLVDYSTGSNGIIEFSSNSTQTIGGSEFCFFNNIVFNNTASGVNDINLNTTISIASEANFSNGIVNAESPSGGIIFENNAETFNVGNDSFVDGLVRKVGDNNFTFPVGDQQFYRPVAISAPVGLSSEFTAKYFFENPNNNYPVANKVAVIDRINENEYWSIENTSGNENVFVTLSWDNQTTPSDIIAEPESAIHIVRWDEANQLWVDQGGVIDPGSNTITTLTTLSDYGIFTIGRVNEDIILPGDVTVYNALSVNSDEVNDFFIIQNIDQYENNKVEIFNRWGKKVYSTFDYGINGNVFRGKLNDSSNGNLVSGTYFYVISYDYTIDDSTERTQTSGYLYLNSD